MLPILAVIKTWSAMKKSSILLPVLSFVFWMLMALPYVNAQVNEDEFVRTLDRWPGNYRLCGWPTGLLPIWAPGWLFWILKARRSASVKRIRNRGYGSWHAARRRRMLYTVMDENGLVVYNLKDINNPQWLARSLPLYCYDGELVVEALLPSFSDGFQRMFIIDVSNPAKTGWNQ